MPQDIKDVTDQYDPPWYEEADLLQKSKKIFKGTFCFPYGSAFGCGEAKKTTTGQEFSLSATLGADIKGITGGVTVGAKYTQQDEWSYTSTKCEYCRPDICFPDSTLTIVERYVIPIPVALEFTYFEPGPRGQIERNCTQNDPLCKCVSTEQTAVFQQSSDVGLFTTPTAEDTLVFQPTGPYKAIEELPEAAVTAQALSDAIDQQWHSAHVRATRPVALGIINPAGDVNYLRSSGSEGPAISLLSRSARDYLTGGQEGRLGPREQCIVAVTQCNSNLVADIALQVESPDGLKRIPGEAAMIHGIATVMAANFDFGIDGLAPDTRALLEITLQDPTDPCVRIKLVEEFRAPPVPWTAL